MSTPTLQTYYREKVVPGLQAKHAYKNVHQIPRLEKIVVTSCMGKHPDRKQAVEDAVNEIAKITGQKPSVTYARKSVANFKVREGEPLGARVTLRGARMWEFLDRFINITAPNIRDFRGLPYKSFDGNGNYRGIIPFHAGNVKLLTGTGTMPSVSPTSPSSPKSNLTRSSVRSASISFS